MDHKRMIAGLIACMLAVDPRCFAQAGPGVAPAPLPDKLLVLKQGKGALIRSAFSHTHDLVQRIGLGSNGQISFHGTCLLERSRDLSAAELARAVGIHSTGDDSTPWNINGTYIGGNHGCSDARLVTIANHGMTARDIGAAWRATNGVNFYLIKVVDKNQLWFLSENKGPDDLWKFVTPIPGTSLVQAVDGTRLWVTNQAMAQWNPACRILQQDFVLDSGAPPPEKESVACRWLDIIERYDIINPASALRQVRAHPGQEFDVNSPDLQAVIENEIRYRFRPDGSCVIRHKAVARQAFKMGYMGFIQTYKLTQGSYAAHGYYVPNTVPFTADGRSFDFRAVQDFSITFSNSIPWCSAENLAAPERYPDRFIQLLGRQDGKDTAWQVGYAAGYSLVQGLSRPDIRFRQAGRAAFGVNPGKKTYPVAVDQKMGSVIPAGTAFDCLAYRQYFFPDPRLKATCCYGNWQGNDYVLYADYHRPVAHERLPVPKELVGQPVSVIDKTDSVTLNTAKAGADGIDVSVKGPSGYVILRVTLVNNNSTP